MKNSTPISQMEKDAWWTEPGAEKWSPALLGQVNPFHFLSLSQSHHLGVLLAKDTQTNGKVEGFKMLEHPSHW